jgi:hypothetical protein
MQGKLVTMRNAPKSGARPGGAAALNAVLTDWVPTIYDVWSRIQEWRFFTESVQQAW